MLTGPQILAADDLNIIEVEVPEWETDGDCTVCLAAMDGATLLSFQRSIDQADGDIPEDFMARFVAACLTDEEGNRLFSDADVPSLNKKNGAVIRKLFDLAQKLNLLDTESSADFPGDSEPTTDSGSGSD